METKGPLGRKTINGFDRNFSSTYYFFQGFLKAKKTPGTHKEG